MSILSELHNWSRGGDISKTDKLRLVVRVIGIFIVIYGGWLIHPGLALIIFGFGLSHSEKEN